MQSTLHFLITAVVEEHFHARLPDAQPVRNVLLMQYDFHAVAFHEMDNTRVFCFLQVLVRGKQSDRLTGTQLVRFVQVRCALCDHVGAIPQGITGLDDAQRMPCVTAPHPFAEGLLAHLTNIFA